MKKKDLEHKVKVLENQIMSLRQFTEAHIGKWLRWDDDGNSIGIDDVGSLEIQASSRLDNACDVRASDPAALRGRRAGACRRAVSPVPLALLSLRLVTGNGIEIVGAAHSAAGP